MYFLLFQAVHKTNFFCYERSWVVPYYGESYLQLKRFYSPSNSFLKIEPKSKPLSCGSSTEIRVHYILTPEAVGEQKKITFYYLVSLHLPYSEVVTGNCRGVGTRSCGLWQQALNTFLSSFICSLETKRRVWAGSKKGQDVPVPSGWALGLCYREAEHWVWAADIQLSSSPCRVPHFKVWLMQNFNHNKVSPSIQVMAKGNIKRGGTHILDLDQESGEFLSPTKLSVLWGAGQLWQTYTLHPWKCRDRHLHVL